MCLKEVGLHAQNMLSILGSILNINEGTYITINVIHTSSKISKESSYNLDLDLLTILY